MIFPLSQYIKIKDNCCIGYFGDNETIIQSLNESKKYIEDKFHGINIFFAINDKFNIDETFIIKKSELADFKFKFAYYYEIDPNITSLKEFLKI